MRLLGLGARRVNATNSLVLLADVSPTQVLRGDDDLLIPDERAIETDRVRAVIGCRIRLLLIALR